MEKLIIQNFGGIESLEIEFKPINVLIGPQGVGKSIVIKLHYFFSDLKIVLSELDSTDFEVAITNSIQRFDTFFPKSGRNNTDSTILFHSDSYQFRVVSSFETGTILTSLFIENQPERLTQEENKLEEDSRSSHYFNLQKNKNRTSKEELFFIPAGRNIFPNIDELIYDIIKKGIDIDPFIIEFGDLYRNFKSYFIKISDDFYSPELKSFIDLSKSILGSTFTRELGRDFLIHDDNRKLNPINASSGQQEFLPLFIILFSLFSTKRNSKITLYIEEPEAHLFPNAQQAIVRLLSMTFNKLENLQIILTTHSPYFLSSFNNHLLAGSIAESKPKSKSKLSKIMPSSEWINPESFEAFAISKTGSKYLVDRETNLIDQNGLDAVSNDLSIQFGKLLDVEFDEKLHE